jgi:hypothetical protein
MLPVGLAVFLVNSLSMPAASLLVEYRIGPPVSNAANRDAQPRPAMELAMEVALDAFAVVRLERIAKP